MTIQRISAHVAGLIGGLGRCVGVGVGVGGWAMSLFPCAWVSGEYSVYTYYRRRASIVANKNGLNSENPPPA